MHDALVEGIVVGDDDLMERYLGDEKIEIAELARRARGRHRDRHACSRCCAAARRSSIGIDRLAHVPRRGGARARRSTDGHAGRARVQDDRRPVRRAREPLQGAAGHGEARRRARQRPHDGRRAPAPALRDARQGAGHRSTEVAAGDIAAVAKLADTAHRRRARARRARRVEVDALSAARAGARGRDPAPSRRATRTSSPTRCTASRTKTRCCASSATPRRTRPCCAGMGETHLSIALEKLARKFGVEVDTEDVQRRVPRDDHRHGRGRGQATRSRPAATASSRSRGCASSRTSAARASSSSTRSSAA